MHSIKELYTIGHGPSSSHTMGPRKAADQFLEKMPEAACYKVILFGSLAATGKGHLTDLVIKHAFKERKYELIWKPKEFLSRHSNAVKFEAYNEKNIQISEWTAYSVGGGMIVDYNYCAETGIIYPLTTMDEILNWCSENGKQLWEYVEEYEGSDIWDFLTEIWETMVRSVENGLEKEGPLPGVLKLSRKSSSYQAKAKNLSDDLRDRALLFAYTLAVSEENASGGKIVTAPTCCACGVLPGVLYFLRHRHGFTLNQVLKALATAG